MSDNSLPGVWLVEAKLVISSSGWKIIISKNHTTTEAKLAIQMKRSAENLWFAQI